jgi:drug/metabolite transporter (DMT)-like permease
MDFTLLGMVVLWYGSSVVCTNTAKELKMQGWSSGSLTVAELAIATGCSFVMMILLKLRPYKPPSMQFNELKLTIMLATAFVFGFVTLNSAFGLMHVSLVMTVRATEPLFTMVAAKCFLGNEVVTIRIMLASLPIVIGAGLSALESADATLSGLVLVFVCNSCFAARGVTTKLLKEQFHVDDFSLFLNICAIGTAVQCLNLGLMAVFFSGPAEEVQVVAEESSDTATESDTKVDEASQNLTMLINGVTFWAYLQLSWLVLGRVSAVTHSVLNSLRRPVICTAGFLRFGGDPTALNITGIALASGGAVLYGQVKRTEMRRVERLQSTEESARLTSGSKPGDIEKGGGGG